MKILWRFSITAAVCLALAGAASAQQVNVCVRSNGKVYVVPNARRSVCRTSETALTLNVNGPQGPQGDPGPTGPQGPPGPSSVPCLSQTGTEATFDGCNVNIRNGAGSTFTQNSLGNLVLGYNEETDRVNERYGSHNLVIGPGHTYTAIAGFVAGYQNTIRSWYTSVTGGKRNTADSAWSSVTGGELNTASGADASVTGGYGNTASGEYSSVTGGFGNTASGQSSSVSGGDSRNAPGATNWVAGGLFEPN